MLFSARSRGSRGELRCLRVRARLKQGELASEFALCVLAGNRLSPTTADCQPETGHSHRRTGGLELLLCRK